MAEHEHYYVPAQSRWPIVGAIGLGVMVTGIVNLLHKNTTLGMPLFMIGALTVSYMLFGWFRDVIIESHAGLYSKQMDRSFRWGMVWFIFSEVMFFMAFFGALFYTRAFVMDWLAGTNGAIASTHDLLWPEFNGGWPLLNNPDPEIFANPGAKMGPTGLPLINTLLLLTSGLTITIAHWGLQKNRRAQLILGLFFTVALGVAFLVFQSIEYVEAYHDLGLRMDTGIYGSTFFMLTGFHGAHVTIGTIMLFIIMIRSIKGHFSPNQHFAFEAVAWYWHFVDVVWLLLFVLVYWL